MVEVRFTGGRDWVDPVGIGDSVDPEFYMPSAATVDFNVSVPTQILVPVAPIIGGLAHPADNWSG